MSESENAPCVFVSYSHDSKEHKQWTLQLAQELRQNHGIDVIIDQWDLEFGDDVPRFMRDSLERADRVLMICTETYVQKANEGKGGVGYEAMIVDGNLVRDLGTRKFIPVVRQDGGRFDLPTSLSTRMAVNLSEDADREEEMKRLVEIIHEIPPPTKPPLGSKPVRQAIVSLPLRSPSEFSEDPGELFESALNLALAGNLVSWRRLSEEKLNNLASRLDGWRKEAEKALPAKKEELPAFYAGGLKCFEQVYSVALAGIESSDARFGKQSSLIHDILEPHGWERGGNSLINALPPFAAYIFQALHGVFAIRTHQPELALQLATSRVPRRYENGSPQLWEHPDLVGWPDALQMGCIQAWDYLYNLRATMPWVVEKAGGEIRFRQALSAYYVLLSWVEFVDTIRNKTELLKADSVRLCVPSMFVRAEELSAGVRSLVENGARLIEYAERNSVSRPQLTDSWPDWCRLTIEWYYNCTHDFRGLRREDNYARLVEDLLR